MLDFSNVDTLPIKKVISVQALIGCGNLTIMKYNLWFRRPYRIESRGSCLNLGSHTNISVVIIDTIVAYQRMVKSPDRTQNIIIFIKHYFSGFNFFLKLIISTYIYELTYHVPVTPDSDIDLGQHWLGYWLVTWRHQVIAWTNVDLFLAFIWEQLREKCSWP